MRATVTQQQTLEAVGDGATSRELARVIATHAFTDLINHQLVHCEWIDGHDLWRLTEAGRQALQTEAD
jgi:hypothetical protein